MELTNGSQTITVLDPFYWGEWIAVRFEDYDPGYTLIDPEEWQPVDATETVPTLSDQEVVERFLDEEGRCFAGDDGFNAAVRAAARRL